MPLLSTFWYGPKFRTVPRSENHGLRTTSQIDADLERLILKTEISIFRKSCWKAASIWELVLRAKASAPKQERKDKQ